MRRVFSSDTYPNRCQVAAWKEHKISCRGQQGQGQQLSLDAIRSSVHQAAVSQDFGEVLRWEGRIEELVAGHDQGIIFDVLQPFARAYRFANKFDKAAPLWVRERDLY